MAAAAATGSSSAHWRSTLACSEDVLDVTLSDFTKSSAAFGFWAANEPIEVFNNPSLSGPLGSLFNQFSALEESSSIHPANTASSATVRVRDRGSPCA